MSLALSLIVIALSTAADFVLSLCAVSVARTGLPRAVRNDIMQLELAKSLKSGALQR